MPAPLGAIVGYLRGKQQLKPSSSYQIDFRNLIMSLDNSSLNDLKREFILNNSQIDLAKFFWLMKQCITGDKCEGLFMYYELTRLFEEIDIDSSDTIDWNEFVEYLAEYNWVNAEENNLGKPGIAENRVLFHAFREQSRFRKHQLVKIVEMQRCGVLCLIEKVSTLSYLNLFTNSKESTEKNHSEVKDDNGTFQLNNIDHNKVISLDYCERERTFGVLLTNKSLVFIEEGEMQKQLAVLQYSANEIEVKYLQVHGLWMLLSVSCTIQLFHSPRQGKIDKRWVLEPHKQPITGIKEINNPLAICTASLDGLIKLWTINSEKLLIELSLSRQRDSTHDGKGVKGITTYSFGLVSYICSWMFTNDIYIWLPSLSLLKSYMGELHGHLCLVEECCFTSQGDLVSLDCKKSLKVWNLDRMECIQNLVLKEENCRLMMLQSQPYLAIYSKIINFYRVKTNTKVDLFEEIGGKAGRGNNLFPNEEDFVKLIGIEFSAACTSLVIVTSECFKIVEVNSCTLVAIMTPIGINEQYIAMTMKSGKNFYVATSSNMIYEYKITNGKQMRCFSLNQIGDEHNEHNEAVKFVYYESVTKVLLTIMERENVSAVCTYQGLFGDQVHKVKDISFEQIDLLVFEYANQLGKFFIGSVDSIITVWDYEKLIIVNRIDMVKLFRLEHSMQTMLIDQSNGILLVLMQHSVAILRIDEQGEAYNIVVLEDSASVEEGNREKRKYVDFCLQRTMIKVIREPVDPSSNYEASRNKIAPNEVDEKCALLMLLDSAGEIFLYRLTELEEESNSKTILKNKTYHIKEKRMAHMKSFRSRGIITSISLNKELFNEYYLCTPRGMKVGRLIDKFFVYGSDNVMFVVSTMNTVEAEWHLPSKKPKKWKIAYNDINEVLTRLEKTDLALQKIKMLTVGSNYKEEYLLAKYFTKEDQRQFLEGLNDDEKFKNAQIDDIKQNRRMATGIFMSENKDNVGRNVRRSLPQQFVRERGFSHEVNKIGGGIANPVWLTDITREDKFEQRKKLAARIFRKHGIRRQEEEYNVQQEKAEIESRIAKTLSISRSLSKMKEVQNVKLAEFVPPQVDLQNILGRRGVSSGGLQKNTVQFNKTHSQLGFACKNFEKGKKEYEQYLLEINDGQDIRKGVVKTSMGKRNHREKLHL